MLPLTYDWISQSTEHMTLNLGLWVNAGQYFVNNVIPETWGIGLALFQVSSTRADPSKICIFPQNKRSNWSLLLFILHIFVIVLLYFQPFSWMSPCGPVASVQVDQLRVPSSSPETSWPLFFGKTTKWPKITHMLPTLSSTGIATLYAMRSSRGHH